jgi:hypothetical protein
MNVSKRTDVLKERKMKYKPKIGEIWITIIPKIETYNNRISNVILERRTCLIIDDGHGFIIEKNNDYLGMKITTQDKKNKKEIRNWYDVGLKYKSFVRIEMPIKIEESQLVKKIGQLSKCDTYVYINELMSFMNNDIKTKFEDRL